MLYWPRLFQQFFNVCLSAACWCAFHSSAVPLCAFDQGPDVLLPICDLPLLCLPTHTQVVVYHRKAGMPRRSYGSDDKFSAPLLMWMPLDQTYDPELHVVPSNAAAKQQLAGSSSSKFADVGSPTNTSSKDVEYIVTEDAPIWQHVRRMLRPFLAVPALRQQPAALELTCLWQPHQLYLAVQLQAPALRPAAHHGLQTLLLLPLLLLLVLVSRLRAKRARATALGGHTALTAPAVTWI
jgi:hypothetical protein